MSSSKRLQSAIYSGWVWHQRHSPKAHGFRYKVFMLYLDLAELDQVFNRRLLWSQKRMALARFKRSDFYGDAQRELGDCVRDRVAEELGFRPTGPIRMLANIRYWGYVINPITCYYCFDATGTRLEAMLLEVTNTPWKERQSYVLRCDTQVNKQQIRFDKTLHVSPFMPMAMEYLWQGSAPGEDLQFTISNYQQQARVFDAGVNFKRHPIKAFTMNFFLLTYPLMTLKVFAGIHWQAVKLFLKGLKIFKHKPQSTAVNLNRWDANGVQLPQVHQDDFAR